MAREEKKGVGELTLTKVVVLLGIAALLVVCAVSISNIFKLHREQAMLKAENERLQEEKASLEVELENVNDLDYIEEQARKLLKMIKPGEVMFVLDESGVPHVVEPDDNGELPNPEDAGIISGESQAETIEEYYEEPYEESYEETYEENPEETSEEYLEEPVEEVEAPSEVIEESIEQVEEQPEEPASEEVYEEAAEEVTEEYSAEATETSGEVPYEETAESGEEGYQG